MAQSSGARLSELGRRDDLPVGVNLAWRLEALIRSGRLRTGERLPGVREFAAGAGVNVNTARAVYRRLEAEGLIASHQGLGTFVGPHAPLAPALEQFAAEVASEAIALGIDPSELARTLYAGTSRDDPFSALLDEERDARPTGEEGRSARAALRGQIARIESQLSAYPEAPTGASRSASAIPRVATIAELEATRDELIARLKRAQETAAARGERNEAALRWREEALADPSAHRWESVSTGDLGEPGCGTVAVRPRWGPVGALMDWWRVKISSGCP